jgi:hypothetical protein
MRSSFGKAVLLVGSCVVFGFCIVAGPAAWGQAPSSLEVAITYNALRANIVPGDTFWMEGGSAQVHGQFWRGLGVVADIAGLHTSNENGAGKGLDMVTATFGPRYSWPLAHHRGAFFGQALVGEANGFHSVFPTATGVSSSNHGLALEVGGGINLSLSRHLGVRAFEADWLRTELPNSTTGVQNNLRLGAGLVFKF